ncbi:MAG: trypsin-like serine protease [Polyangiaceae bacterium]
MIACGSSGKPSAEEERALREPIIGGHTDTTTKGVVALALKRDDQVGVFCSGSLLAPNLVLTARHCIALIDDGTDKVDCDTSEFTAKFDPRQIFVSTDSQPQSSGGKLYPVREIREAPGSSKVCGFDVALLVLSGSGVPASVATAIEPVLDDPTLSKVTFSAVGYGLQDPSDETTAGTRQRFDSSSVFCVGSKCPAAWGAEADEFVGDSPVCSGDSGGPALDSAGRVFGVTSRGDAACTYALYSNVASWSDFVRSAGLAAATDGGYTPPSWAATDSTANGGASGVGASAGAPAVAAGAGGATVAVTPPTQPVTPTVDPLGASCSSKADCPGTYQCYSSTAEPPGTCTPPCTSANTTCPTGYSCSVQSQVCVPPASVTKHLSASCSLSQPPQRASNAAFALLLGLGFAWFGRRRRSVE